MADARNATAWLPLPSVGSALENAWNSSDRESIAGTAT